MFTVVRSTGEASGFAPAASSWLRRRPSPRPAGPSTSDRPDSSPPTPATRLAARPAGMHRTPAPIRRVRATTAEPRRSLPAQAGSIVQHPEPAAVAGRNHPARRAAGFDLIRLHRHDQPAVTIIPNIEHVHASNIKDRIGSGAPAHTPATHRVGHRRVLRGTGAWSPLILKVPTPLLGHQHAPARHGHTTVNSEDPLCIERDFAQAGLLSCGRCPCTARGSLRPGESSGRL
jgi:hypothetical protein